MGPDKGALGALYLASELGDQNRTMASVMDGPQFELKFDIDKVKWDIVIEYTISPGTQPTREMVGRFLDRHIGDLAKRFPEIIGCEETDRKPPSAPRSMMVAVEFPKGATTLGELVAIVEDKTLNRKLRSQLEAMRMEARTPEARGLGRGIRL